LFWEDAVMSAFPSLQGQTILITGGSGSFGRAAARRILTEGNCAKLIIFSRDEWKQWEMRNSDPVFKDPRIRYFLGDVRDSSRLARAFRGVNIVIHAAALKQVPAAEYNPTEFIKTNILGAINVIDNTIERGVQKLIALSTDKSVNPVNLYGATKLCSDKLFIAGNAYVGEQGHPKISIVRYGNVLGSRGSVIPYWYSVIEKGAKSLPITDPAMTRFWITLDHAVDFVLKCIERMQGEEIFVPKVPSVRITELAKAVAPEMPHEIVGIREGEKLHELLLSSDEARYTLKYPDCYLILPPVHKRPFEERVKRQKYPGEKVPDNFQYSSATNEEWFSAEQVKEIL